MKPTPNRKPYQTSKASGGMTYHQIAAVLGVSHTRVQQIEAEAVRKIKLEMRRRRLQVGDLLISDSPLEGWRRS